MKNIINARRNLFVKLSLIILFSLLIIENSLAYNLTLIGTDKNGQACIFKIDKEIIPVKVGQTYKEDEILIHVFNAYPLKGEKKESLCEFITNLKDVQANKINGNIYSIRNDTEDASDVQKEIVMDGADETITENKEKDIANNSKEDEIVSYKRYLGFFEWVKRLVLNLFEKLS